MSKLDMKGRNGFLSGSTVGVRHPADLPSQEEQEEERARCTCRWVLTRGGTQYEKETCPLHTPPAHSTDEPERN